VHKGIQGCTRVCNSVHVYGYASVYVYMYKAHKRCTIYLLDYTPVLLYVINYMYTYIQYIHVPEHLVGKKMIMYM